MDIEKGIFRRTELLLGNSQMNKIASKRVILFGVGGVGSWCAESLVRSGIRYITIVDADRVCVTNINRQLMATTKTVGQIKVDVLKERLLDINPAAEVRAIQGIYSRETSDSFHLEEYDYIIDAIDSLGNKMDLICTASKTNAVLFASMGAALKMNPDKIKVTEFWKVEGCPLAAALRRKFRKGERPAKKFLCVYSDELLENKGEGGSCIIKECGCMDADEAVKKSELLNPDFRSIKVQINGTLSYTTAIFGLRLAGLVIQDICNKASE